MDEDKTKQRIYKINFAGVYPLYIAKAEKKGRTKEEVDEVIRWLTGYTQKGLETQIRKQSNIEAFINEAPKMNSAKLLIKGKICGIKVEDIKDPVVQGIRYLDKLIDELARGRKMEKILRKEESDLDA